MIRPNGSGASRSRRVPRSRADDPIRAARAAAGLWCSPEGQPTSCGWRRFLPSDSWRASSRPMPVIFSASRLNGAMELLLLEFDVACSPAFGGHPASIVPAAYSSVPKTGQNRRTSRPHLALRGTTWHKAPPTCTRTCAFEGPLGSPRRAIQPSSREKTAHDLRVGELQWTPEDGENVTNRTVNAPLKTGQNAEIGNAAVRAASGERAARARLPITVIDRQSLGEALAWWRKSYAT